MNREEEKLLEYAVSLCREKKNALDLGCGSGGHSIFLAQKGFLVDSVDSDPKVLEKLKERIKENIISGIAVIDSDIAQFASDKKYDLIVAASSLHFFRLQTIKNILAKIKNWLVNDGVLFLRIFSNQDDEFIEFAQKGLQVASNEIFSPKINKHIHYFDKEEVMELMKDFTILKLEETKKFAKHPPSGEHWHWMFEVVARKI